MNVRALLITGTVGSGKTSVADALGDLLAAAAVPHAILDLDWLRRSWPSPPDDPFHNAMTLRNLRSVAGNYVQTGAARLVLAGVIESHQERHDYQQALGADLTVCRLRVDLPVVRQRLAQRHEPDKSAWFLNRAAELDAVLTEAQLEDFTVETADDSIHQVAAAVADAWEQATDQKKPLEEPTDSHVTRLVFPHA